MAWHMGHPLSQTLFTSIYLNKLLWPVPKTLDEANFGVGNSSEDESGSPLVNVVLRTYCLALVKACDFIHARVASEYYYEVRSLEYVKYALRLICFRKRISLPSSTTAVF